MKSGKFKKAVSFFALASVFTMAGCQKDEILEEAVPTPSEPTATSSAVAGKYIVVLKDGSTSSESLRERVLGSHRIKRERIKQVFDGASDGFAGSLSREEVEALKADKDVAYIEPEQAVMLGKPLKTTTNSTTSTSSTTTTTTTTTSTQEIPWGVARVGYGDGTGKTVWVIDSGVDTDHPDLNVDVARSKSFISGVTSVEDGYGHGTGVAGIIGAKNNNIGVVGVAANATIVALRVFDDTGYGTLTRIYSALNHVYKNGKPGDVVNMSLRVDGSTLLDDLVKKTAARGIYIAIAAGNSYIDCKNDSPARVVAPNVYVVSNMDSYGKFNSTSNFGTSVKFAAPGTAIRSTSKNGTYANGNGTSFAAPHVAGILALNGGRVNSQGTVVGDPDGKADPIALK
ncbi:S8 family serine peptidase [Rufibacter quisquiliarum]|uniref:Subtilisin family serine protease n=1 Tax=Rufibacter quisquiliarum TaxID=1549639 RepID=A0A839GME8_9BACT|nr:S8 family serine peptidase [Rufibacter quisquiliarum]MBA9077999.1 subtilisin family serine protease [Rufibacter quisquiliarum]